MDGPRREDQCVSRLERPLVGPDACPTVTRHHNDDLFVVVLVRRRGRPGIHVRPSDLDVPRLPARGREPAHVIAREVERLLLPLVKDRRTASLVKRRQVSTSRCWDSSHTAPHEMPRATTV